MLVKIGRILGSKLMNLFKKYYQYIPFTSIEQIDGLWYFVCKGWGLTLVKIQIKNTQVATFTGTEIISFGDLSGITITDSEGTTIPTISGNNIEVTAGYLVWFEISTGERFYLMCGKDDKIYGTLGTVGTLSTTTGVWDITRNDIEPYALTKGGSLFKNDTDDEYLRIVGYDLSSIIGYTKIGYFTVNCGFWNTGNTLYQPSGDAGLFALSEAYSLGWYGADLNSPLEVDWDILSSYKYDPLYNLAIQDIFATTPTTENDETKWVDQSGEDNNLLLSDSFWWKSTSAMSAYPTAQYDVGVVTEFTCIISCYVDDVLTNTNLLGGFGLGAIPHASGTILDFQGTDINSAYITGLDSYLGKPIRLAFTTNSGGLQRCYINGVKIDERAANSFSKSGYQSFTFGRRVGNADAKFWNYQVFNKQLSDNDILFDYNNPYLTAFDNPTFNIPYTNKKNIMVLWWKMTTGYANDGTSSSNEIDASGNLRNSFGLITNDLTVGWVADNPYWHANQIHGFTKISIDDGVNEYYSPFDVDGNPTVNYINDLQGRWRKHCKPDGSFLDCESSISQIELDVPDYNNFWYDGGGIPNKKKFSDFVDFIINDQLFFNISEKFYIKQLLTTNIQTTSTAILEQIQNNEVNSRNILVFGDSMPGSIDKVLNQFELNINNEYIAKISNVGGQHSYQSVDGWFTSDGQSSNRLPLDIKTRYPENPNGLWTGYDTEENGTLLDYFNILTWEQDYYQVVWFGTNNPDNTYVGTFDYGEVHYRLAIDLDLAYALNNQTNKQGVIIMHGNLDSSNYDAAELVYRNKATEFGYDYIDPKSFFSDLYKLLVVDSTDDPVIQKLIELDTQEQYIKVINNKVYVWNDFAARTNASGQPVNNSDVVVAQGEAQGTIEKWVNLGENTPNTIVNIDSVDYDVYNPNLNSDSVTGNPFILDEPETWTSSLHRDGIHPNSIALALLAAQIQIFKDAQEALNVQKTAEDRRKDFQITIGEDGCITKLATEPFQGYKTTEGEYPTNEGVYKVIKDF